MTLRLLFAGTPEFAVPALKALIESKRLPLAVLTQPDRGAGRGRRLASSPVKRLALEHGLPVLQPPSLKGPEVLAELAAFRPDLLVTAAYGLILPQAILDLPRFGCWNLHASLLPRWRGASPINQAILHGDQQTGISLMQMDAGLDTGPVLARVATPIHADETAGQLHDRLAPMAADLLLDSLELLLADRLPPARPQAHSGATHAPLINKSDAHLDWQRPASELARMVRAYNPWPVAWGELEGLDVRVFRARASDVPGDVPGRLVRGHDRRDAVLVGCGEGSLDVLELQAPGRKRLAAGDWLNAHPDWR
ncbi:MAG: methionyl-tRNA formyltransferase [Wenzhouxiangella sp.]|nr:MAG: methionyl-tRNA formyltransferase [Wenzhouxiangella sp.]